MNNFRKTKTDHNQAEIFEHLRDHKIYVKDMSGGGSLTDGFTFDSVVGFMEIKKNGRATYTRLQLDFMANCPAPVGIVKTKEDALEFARNPQANGLTRKQKDRIAIFLLAQPKDKRKFTSEQIEKVLEVK